MPYVPVEYLDDTLLVAAAEAIASTVTDEELNANYIIPSVFHADVHTAVAAAVRDAGLAEGAPPLDSVPAGQPAPTS
jgi:malate dehydrogenase (oxaloacetate-decarboxylating)